ncbi:MAG TPA: hypothetical protein VK892_14160 [Pyrinomonadaceae bacterium]|nr:hypothetical protein [Pyrinomonadaceae bacterium]
MRIKIAFTLLVLCFGLYYAIAAFTGCKPTWIVDSGEFSVCPDRPYDLKNWKITWWNGTEYKSNFAYGQCCFRSSCDPLLEEPRSFPSGRFEEWAQTSYDRTCGGFKCENKSGPRTVTSTRDCPSEECRSASAISGEKFIDESVDTANSTECSGGNPVIYSQYCSNYYLVTDYYISYDGGETWHYWYSDSQYMGSNCMLYQ